MTAKIFVGNLSFSTTQEELLDLFSQAGQVVDVFLPEDRATGRPRGFAFIEFADSSGATAAVDKFSGYELGGREIRVDEARERVRTSPPSHQGFGGGFGGGGGGFRGDRPSKSKGSRRNVRGKKRSL